MEMKKNSSTLLIILICEAPVLATEWTFSSQEVESIKLKAPIDLYSVFFIFFLFSVCVNEFFSESV